MTEDQFEIELRGAKEGINPVFGEWRQRFDFEPVSYSNQSEKRKEFKETVRQHLSNNFYYTNEVKVKITLYLEEQKVLETPAYGDLDNYAKSIFDAIKGKGGLLIDDCQVQSLDICWIDIPQGTYFEIELKAGPDDFMQSSLKLHEMPDGLFYPQSQEVWSVNGIDRISVLDMYASLWILHWMTSRKRKLRHSLREEGLHQFRAFQFSKSISPVLMGFHKTRIVDSGFDLVTLKDWKDKYERWKAQLDGNVIDRVLELEGRLKEIINQT